jgi:hypothetical protein
VSDAVRGFRQRASGVLEQGEPHEDAS